MFYYMLVYKCQPYVNSQGSVKFCYLLSMLSLFMLQLQKTRTYFSIMKTVTSKVIVYNERNAIFIIFSNNLFVQINKVKLKNLFVLDLQGEEFI